MVYERLRDQAEIKPSEGDIEEFAFRTKEAISGLDQDSVRIIDLVVSSRRRARWFVSNYGSLNPHPPNSWNKYYRKLDNLEKLHIGNMLGSLIRAGLAPTTLKEIQNQELEETAYPENIRKLLTITFGVKFNQ